MLADDQQARERITQLSLRSLKFLQFCRIFGCFVRIELDSAYARPSVRHFG